MVCYNCGLSSHTSLFCPEPQQYSRCTGCQNVCFTQNCHKESCGVKQFRSEYFGRTEKVAEMKEFLQLSFQPVDGVVLCKTENDEVYVTRNTFWFANSQMLLRRSENGDFVFEAPCNRARSIVVIDQNNKRRLQITVGSKFKMNDHYEISTNGDIEYDRFKEQSTLERYDCMLKVYFKAENPVFYARAEWSDMVLFFDVYTHGVTFKDPLVMKNWKAANDGQKGKNIFSCFFYQKVYSLLCSLQKSHFALSMDR